MNSKRVLIVDDEADMRIFVSTVVETSGLKPVTAGDGTKALNLARREPLSLVILDVMMPQMDGFDVLKRLRRESDIPVLMLTARGEETDRIVGLEMGADDYITKPFSNAEVVRQVKDLLSG